MATNIQIISIKCDVDVTKFTECASLWFITIYETSMCLCRRKSGVVVGFGKIAEFSPQHIYISMCDERIQNPERKNCTLAHIRIRMHVAVC